MNRLIPLILLYTACMGFTEGFAACTDEEVDATIASREKQARYNRHVEAANAKRAEAEDLELQADEILKEINNFSEDVR